MQILQAPLGIQSSRLGNSRPLGQPGFLLHPLLRLHQQSAPLVNAKKLTLVSPTLLIHPSRFLQAEYQPLNESNFEFPFTDLEPFYEPSEDEVAPAEEQELPPERSFIEPAPSPVTATSPAKVSVNKTTSSHSSKLSRSSKTNSSRGNRTKSASKKPTAKARSSRSKSGRVSEIQTGENTAIEMNHSQLIRHLDGEKQSHADSTNLLSEDSLNLDLSNRELRSPETLYRSPDLIPDPESISTEAIDQNYTKENHTGTRVEAAFQPVLSKAKQNRRTNQQNSQRKSVAPRTDRQTQRKADPKKHNLKQNKVLSDQEGVRSEEPSKTKSRKVKQGKIADAIAPDQLADTTLSTTDLSPSTPDELLVSDRSIEDITALDWDSDPSSKTSESQLDSQRNDSRHHHARYSDSKHSDNPHDGDRSPLTKSFVQPPFKQNRQDNAVNSQIVFEQSQPGSSEVIQKFTASDLSAQDFSVGGPVEISRSPAKPIDPSDTVPAMLAPGEFVVNVEDAQKHLPLLHHINQGGRLETAPIPTQEAETTLESEASVDMPSAVNSPTHLPGGRSPLTASFVQPPFKQTQLNNAVTQIVFEQSQPGSSEVIQKFTASDLSAQGFSVGGPVEISRSPAKPIDPSDTVPAMLAPGEFVVNVEDAQKHLPLLHHINQGGRLETAPVPTQEAETTLESEASVDMPFTANSPTDLPNRATESALGQRKQTKGSPNGFRLVPAPVAESHEELTSFKPLQSGTFDDYSSDPNPSPASYASPPLIFRSKLPSPSASSSSAFEWSSVEDLLGMESEPMTDSLSHSAAAPVLSQQPWQGFAQGGEVTIPPETGTFSTETPTGAETIAASTAPEAKENAAEKTEAAIETLAQEIYSRLQQRLAIERERQGAYSGRLPW